MLKFLKELGWRISLILIGALLSPVVSRFIGEQYPDFIKRQPRGVLAGVLIVTGIILVMYWIVHRVSATKKSNIDRQVPPYHVSQFGREECFAFLEYRKVFWTVEFPSIRGVLPPLAWQNPTNDAILQIRPERITVDYNPICPECSFRLDERDTFLGWYRWKCPECNFHTTNRRSFSSEMKRATLLAREEFRKVKAGEESKTLRPKKGYATLFKSLRKA